MKIALKSYNKKVTKFVKAMEITHLLSEGQVIIPQNLRVAQKWAEGQELVVIDVGDGLLIKPKKPFPETTLEEVAGCLAYYGKPKSLDELDEAISTGVKEKWHDIS